MTEIVWKKETVTDVVNLALGEFLFLSPWMFGYAPAAVAIWNAWLSGLVIVGLAIAARPPMPNGRSGSTWLLGFGSQSPLGWWVSPPVRQPRKCT
jgi:hypothetical protein